MAAPGSTRARGDEGAVLVEAALVLPFLFMLISALVDFGLGLNDSQSVRQGAMDGARQIAVGNIGSFSCTPSSVSGTWSQSTNVICLVKNRTNISAQSNVRVAIAWQTSGTCNSGGTASGAAPCTKKGDPIAICVQYPLRSYSGFWNFIPSGSVVKTQVVERLEKDMTTVPTAVPVQEAAPSGSNWSWCTAPTP